MHTAIIKALEERQRQINEEGFDASLDDHYVQGELSQSAIAYAMHDLPATLMGDNDSMIEFMENIWPWDATWWKPSPDPQRNIIKAMALLSAEYDRLERAKAAASPAYALEYLYSTDDEWQSGSYDDLHDLIVDREREAGDVAYRGVKRWDKATDYTLKLGESVIEGMQLQAEEEAGEAGEHYPEASLPQARVLQELIDAWATTYCPPDFYTIADVQEITITFRDVRLAHQEFN